MPQDVADAVYRDLKLKQPRSVEEKSMRVTKQRGLFRLGKTSLKSQKAKNGWTCGEGGGDRKEGEEKDLFFHLLPDVCNQCPLTPRKYQDPGTAVTWGCTQKKKENHRPGNQSSNTFSEN